ncbi:MAG TPA: antibiotic biosynthesis monooxygenase [Actinomycetota bacterium]|nr:antibiotic biosynthesis monooxygenase [Actinomycetota bacterium]
MSYARVTMTQVQPETVDAGIESFRSQVLETARSLPGYKGASLLLDRANGRAIGMSFWESEQALADASARMDEARAETLRTMGVDPSGLPSADVYEVVVDDYDV